jgi:hypothetical protein
MPPEVSGDSAPGDPSDLGGDELNDRQQRKGQREGPRKRVAEARADLAVRANAARIVVGGASDNARPEFRQEAVVLFLCQLIPLPGPPS